MVNYYIELGLEPGADQAKLEADLKALRRTWTSRASTAADPSKRQKAEQKVALIREATETLLDKKKRERYDKELDKKGEKNAESWQEFEAPSAASASFMDHAALMDMLESCYENGKYNQAIAAANKLIENGAANVEVYRYLVYCYAEKGDDSRVYQTLRQIEYGLPNDPEAILLIASVLLRILNGKEQEARVYLDRLIEMGYGETSDVAALDVEYQIDCGSMEAAEQKTNAFLAEYGKDENFCMYVSNAYIQAANRNATEIGGDIYFDRKEDFTNFAALVEKANQIYAIEENEQILKDLRKTTMVPEWWIGVLSFLMYGICGLVASPLILLFCIAAAVVLFYFSRVPNWMALRFQYKNHLLGMYEVFRWINIIFSIWIRISWEIAKWVIRLLIMICGRWW